MIEQTEAERQAMEKAAAEKAAAEKRTAEVDARFNKLLRGEPQEGAQRKPTKAEKKLEALAAEGDGEALQMLAELRQARKEPPPSADGGAGRNSPSDLPRDPAQAFNDMIRDAHRPERAFPAYLRWRP